MPTPLPAPACPACPACLPACLQGQDVFRGVQVHSRDFTSASPAQVRQGQGAWQRRYGRGRGPGSAGWGGMWSTHACTCYGYRVVVWRGQAGGPAVMTGGACHDYRVVVWGGDARTSRRVSVPIKCPTKHGSTEAACQVDAGGA